MSKNILLFLIIAIIVIGGGAVLLTKTNKNVSVMASPSPSMLTSLTPRPAASQATQESTSQFVVNYTAQGFSPSSITVPVGSTVQFKNNSSNSVWVASNPHPTHTDYPGFDVLKAYTNGQAYSFTFKKTGNWGYHNHLNPVESGTVIVQ